MTMTEIKKKELLPDILAHQSRVFEHITCLNVVLDAFQRSWRLDEKLKKDDGPSEKEIMSTVDEIYRRQQRVEEQLDALYKRLSEARENYLGNV